MTVDEIGENAGIVWRAMSLHERWSYVELKKFTGLSDRQLNTAIGWLARENKVQIEEKCGDRRTLSLCMNLYI